MVKKRFSLYNTSKATYKITIMTKTIFSPINGLQEIFTFHATKTIPVATRRVEEPPCLDVITPYFSIPTATRAQNIFQEHSVQSRKKWLAQASLWKKCQFLLSEGVDFLLDKAFSEPYELDIHDICPPRELHVYQLPEPPFTSHEAPRCLFLAGEPTLLDQDTPPCLLRDSQGESLSVLQNQEKILSFVAKSLPQKGIIKMDPSGLLYLYIAPSYQAEKLLPFLVPHQEFRQHTHEYIYHPLGIQCPITLPSETHKCKNLGIEKEIGKEIPFSVRGAFEAVTESDSLTEKAWFLELECLELHELREYYLLPGKLQGHPFPVTLLLKKRHSLQAPDKKLFRLNVSCFVA